MASDFPPWQVFRWTYTKHMNIIERWDAEKEQWVTHDNELLRAAFHEQADASLHTIEPVTDKQAAQLTATGSLTSEK